MTIENLIAWSLQVFALAAAGTLLPWLFRLRDPRWQPRYYQALLALCLLLPVVQPWHRETIRISAARVAAAGSSALPVPAPAAPPRWTMGDVAPAILAGGIALRGLWLLIGLLRLRKHRAEATPLYSPPPAVEAALERTRVDALLCLSADNTGPVTFGLGTPVVLLPKSFLDLSHDAQFAVACHELLHVRRCDWAQHIAEEIVCAVLWFHPAVWWLVSRIRLTREQAVDREVVQLTQAREPYVDALLTMSGARPSLDLAPAPLFLRRRHLVERISSIVREVSMSRKRLVSSYATMSAALAGAVWICAVVFPLRGLPQVVAQPAPVQQRGVAGQIVPRGGVITDGPGITVSTPGTILHRAGVRYPAEATRARIEGIVVIEMTLDEQGNVTDARAVSGPQQLRRAALESVLNWHYAPNTGSPIQATIDFRLQPPAQAQAAPPPSMTSGVLDRVDLSNLPEGIQGLLRPVVTPYEGRPMADSLVKEILEKVREVEPHLNIGIRTGKDVTTLTLNLAGSTQPPMPVAAFEPAPDGTRRIRIGGNVQASKLVNKIQPEYPPLARQARIQGTVRFDVLITPDGTVKNLQLVSGHPLLVQVSYDAVRQWTWQPTLLNGERVEVQTVVDVNFALSE